MNIKPIQDKVIIKREIEKRDSGIIVINTDKKEKNLFGEVMAVGPGLLNDHGVIEETTVKVGDRVAFTRFKGTEICQNDVTYIIIKEEFISGVCYV